MYLTIATMTDSTSLQRRVAACAAQEVNAASDPLQWAFDNRWEWASAPAWANAWESAEAGGNPDPGADPAVITDPMILAQVQSMTDVG